MKKLILACLTASLLAIGCGGGGGGGTSNPPPGGNAKVKMFITDAPIASFQSVWVTIRKVELLTEAGAATTVYDTAEGNIVDLARLSDNGVSQFELLGIASIPAGNYDDVRITLDESVTLIPKGGGAGLPRTFAGSQGGLKVITFELNRNLGNQDNLVIDFDLEHWQEDGSLVTAVVRSGGNDGLDDNSRHEYDEYEGTISNLTGTGTSQTFTLNRGVWSVVVQTNETTSIYNNNGAPNPTLANGIRVHVRGKFDTAVNAVVATSVKIKNGGGEDEDEAEGQILSISGTTFTLRVTEAEGFVPAASELNVTTNAATRFFSKRGIAMTSEEFFSLIGQNPQAIRYAEAEGIYDEATNTLTATKVKIEDGDDDRDDDLNESEVEGPASNIDTAARTFQVTVSQWEGVPVEVGTVLTVTVNAGTEFRGESGGDELTIDQFFARLGAGSRVEVKGALNGTTLEAERVKFEDGDDDDDDDSDDD